MMKTVSIIVTGKVQGVFYRQSTKEKATALGVKGEVKNMPDETVCIIATGNSNEIEQLIEWCRQGPSRAEVTNVIVEENPLKLFEKFSIVR
ncbi:MAG: acylphosphatase [Bacteroidota bacterium]